MQTSNKPKTATLTPRAVAKKCGFGVTNTYKMLAEGIRTSDSRVICAAIRTAKADRHLKEAFEELAGNDARRVENR